MMTLMKGIYNSFHLNYAHRKWHVVNFKEDGHNVDQRQKLPRPWIQCYTDSRILWPSFFWCNQGGENHSYRIGISGTRHASYAIRFLKTTQCHISLEIQGTQLERNNSNCNPFVCTASLQYYLNRLIQNTAEKKAFARNGKETLLSIIVQIPNLESRWLLKSH